MLEIILYPRNIHICLESADMLGISLHVGDMFTDEESIRMLEISSQLRNQPTC